MMKTTLTICALSLTLLACTKTQENHAIVGNDRDAHGCIGSAGYSWCEKTAKCERPWELAKKEGFESTPENFEQLCKK